MSVEAEGLVHTDPGEELMVPVSYDPPRGKVGMAFFLLTEVAFFSTLIMTYIFYIGKGPGPTPAECFDDMALTILGTVFLLASSVTIHFAIGALEQDKLVAFRLWWFVTILLGVLFLVGTGVEWYGLLNPEPGTRPPLTIATNLFGTTYYTLVGFHAFHVSLGVVFLSVIFGLALSGRVTRMRFQNVDLISWYWHFVDGVWIVVFTIVYVVGR